MEFKVGDKVRVKGCVEKPTHGWAGITHEDVGVVEKVYTDRDMLGVVFPESEGSFKRSCWSADPSEMELVETRMEGIGTLYKPLVWRSEGGQLESLTTIGKTLYYTEGRITYAPEGSMGIFVSSSLAIAKGMGLGNRGYKLSKVGEGIKDALVVYEVIPLGNRFPYTDVSFGGSDRYPAILLGKEVWRDEPVPPKEEWEEVTKDITCRGNCGRAVIEHKGIELMELTLSKPYIASPVTEGRYKIEPAEEVVTFGVKGERQDFRVFKKVKQVI